METDKLTIDRHDTNQRTLIVPKMNRRGRNERERENGRHWKRDTVMGGKREKEKGK